MKILVAIKRVVDYNVNIRIKPDFSDVDLANTKMSMNPFCEIAVEEAIRIKESGHATEVVVASIGNAKSEEQLRAAMALGADRGLLIETEQNISSLQAAKLLKVITDQEQPTLIILGKQSIDSDNNQTGQMLAALTGYAQATFASNVVMKDNGIEVTREVDGGLQTLALSLPAVITTDLRLNEPRYAKLPDIMKAKKKPLDKIIASDLLEDLSTQITLHKVEPPADRQAGIKVNSVAELVDKLKHEAKVIN